jgi:hypothetical protein
MDRWEILHIVFALWIVAAGAAVWRGAKLEESSYDLDKERGKRLIRRGLLWQIVPALLLIVVDSVVAYHQSNEIITLRRLTAMRDISPDEMKRASEALSKFSGQPAKIVVFPVNFESVWIASKVYGILLDAHWQVPYPDRLQAAPGKGFMIQGIFVDHSSDDASRQAADAARIELNLTVAQTGGAPSPNVSTALDPNEPLVWIMIGDRPAPLSSWIAR